MKTKALLFSVGVVLGIPVTLPVNASAQVRKDVSEYAGQRCSPPPRGSGIVFGQFNGVDDSPFVSGGGLMPVNRMRCFTSMTECRGWLYTMQSKYTNAGSARVVRCLKR